MDKFGRNYQLYIDAGEIPLTSIDSAGDVDKILIQPPFTLEFDVIRNILSSANTSSIRVINLGESTRKKIYKDQYAADTYKGIELKAGYGQTMPTIFKGNVSQAWSERQGTDYYTICESYDGGFALVNSVTSATFKSGTPKNVMLSEMQKNLKGVKPGVIGDFQGNLSRGNTFFGNSADLINEISEGAFFVDLEKSHMLGDSECLRGSVPVITSESGLLGSPRRQGTLVVVEMIFEPRLVIGQSVELRSKTEKNFNGEYKVMSLHHRGTISDAVARDATTTVGLWFGTQILRVIE